MKSFPIFLAAFLAASMLFSQTEGAAASSPPTGTVSSEIAAPDLGEKPRPAAEIPA